MNADERRLIEVLDSILSQASVRTKIDATVAQVKQELTQNRAAVMAWRPIPMSIYSGAIPNGMQSSWVFILRAGATTGAERHPNSHQRVMSYRGGGDLQTIVDGKWTSHELVSDPNVPLLRRWASIPVNVWHQAVVPHENWVVVSFHTALAHELIEERPDEDTTCQRLYVTEEDS